MCSDFPVRTAGLSASSTMPVASSVTSLCIPPGAVPRPAGPPPACQRNTPRRPRARTIPSTAMSTRRTMATQESTAGQK